MSSYEDEAANDKFVNSKDNGGSKIVCLFFFVALLISMPFAGIGALEVLFIDKTKFLMGHLR